MTPKRPIRSRQDRAHDSAPAAGVPALDEDDPSGDEERLRVLARKRGFRLVKDDRVLRQKRIRSVFHISLDVRRVMEQAKLELGLEYSQMAERGLVMFLESRGLHVEGWSGD